MKKSAPLDLERLLNPEQVAAVTHGEGPQLVLAGAGSGKTRVITYRIYWLVENLGVDPGTIAAMTFTNKAAGEMRERVEDLLGIHPLPTSVGTFHRYGLILLRRYGERVGLRRDFHILDTSDQLGLIKEALGAEGLSETAFSPRSVLGQISAAKNRLLDAAAYEAQAQNFFEKKVAALYRRYQGLLGQASGVDFDDLIALSVKLLSTDQDVRERIRSRTRFLLVDEYQDTNHAQLRLVQELSGPNGNLTAVGDEDQGIYRWRGADLNNILEFEKTFPGAVVRKLERNYRSTQTILDISGALIANNVNRRGKRLWTDSGAGPKAELYKASDEGDEATWIIRTLQRMRGTFKLGDMAVLVRTNAQTRAIEDELLSREIPYSLVGGVRFYDRAEIKDLVAYLRVLRNPRDNFSLLRIVNQPPRGIGKSTLELLRDRAVQLGQPLWDVIYLDDLGNLPARSATALRKFRDLIVGLQHAAADLPLPALLDRLLEATAYTEPLQAGRPGRPGAARKHPRVPLRRPGVHGVEQLQRGRRPGSADGIPRPHRAGDGPGHPGGRKRGLPDDLPQRQGAGVPGRGGRRAGRRPPPPLQLPGRAGRRRRGAPSPLRGHDPFPRAAVPHLLPPPPDRRPLPGPGRVAVPRRAAGPAHGRLREPGPLHGRALRPAHAERVLVLRRRPGASGRGSDDASAVRLHAGVPALGFFLRPPFSEANAGARALRAAPHDQTRQPRSPPHPRERRRAGDGRGWR